MNKRQKEVFQSQLDAEMKTLRELKQVYRQALKDCETKIRELSARTDMENLQSIIYQKRYQEALKRQLEGVMTSLQSNSYSTVSDYLARCYQDGYIGAMYDLHGQGIPIIVPIDQKAVTRAIQTDSKISQGLYTRLGEDVKSLKTSIRAELSRGIANGSSWNDIARKIGKAFKNTPFSKAYNNSMRIARTEGHRVQIRSAMDAQQAAKDKGANVVKQWDATLDDRTRETHRMLDGQIRELDEPFEVGGMRADAPGMFNNPAEDCNCRCALLQRARWALDDDELKVLEERAAFFGLDKSKDFEEFKQKYLKLPDNADTMKIEPKSEAYKMLLQQCKVNGVQYKQVEKLQHALTTEQIIDKISGGDKTKGSCVSMSMTYIANKSGLDVLDYRGGNSCYVFSVKYNNRQLASLSGVKGNIIDAKTELKGTMDVLKTIDIGKEYMLNTGGHSSIIRRVSDSEYEYLELQSGIAEHNGWTSFNSYGSMSETLIKRFGCRKTQRKILGHKIQSNVMLLEVDSFKNCTEFEELLGYINTSESNQKKGVSGHVK